MPIEHSVDREKRLVTAALRDVVTYDDLGEALREGRPGATRTVEVFRDRGDAERWLSSESSVPE